MLKLLYRNALIVADSGLQLKDNLLRLLVFVQGKENATTHNPSSFSLKIIVYFGKFETLRRRALKKRTSGKVE